MLLPITCTVNTPLDYRPTVFVLACKSRYTLPIFILNMQCWAKMTSALCSKWYLCTPSLTQPSVVCGIKSECWPRGSDLWLERYVTCHRLSGIPTYRLDGLRKRHAHPAEHLLSLWCSIFSCIVEWSACCTFSNIWFAFGPVVVFGLYCFFLDSAIALYGLWLQLRTLGFVT